MHHSNIVQLARIMYHIIDNANEGIILIFPELVINFLLKTLETKMIKKVWS